MRATRETLDGIRLPLNPYVITTDGPPLSPRPLSCHGDITDDEEDEDGRYGCSPGRACRMEATKAMEASIAAAEAINSARKCALNRLRLLATTSALTMCDVDLIRFATACALRYPEQAIGFMFSDSVLPRLLSLYPESAILPAEFDAFFGCAATAFSDTTQALASVTRSLGGSARIHGLENALGSTLAEQSQSERWQSDISKCAAAVALGLEREVSHEALRCVVGDVMRTDTRRLDELQVEEDDNPDVCTVVQMIDALAQSIRTDSTGRVHT
jgi:hypothetical protein